MRSVAGDVGSVGEAIVLEDVIEVFYRYGQSIYISYGRVIWLHHLGGRLPLSHVDPQGRDARMQLLPVLKHCPSVSGRSG